MFTYPGVATYLGINTSATNALEQMLLKQPYQINDALENAPNGFALLNGELRLYGEGCLC